MQREMVHEFPLKKREMVHEQGTGSHHHHHLPRFGTGNNTATTGVARASKKNKPKKIPQRGMGVAELEKIRIEEEKMMEGVAAAAMAVPGAAHAHLGGGLGHHLPMHPPPPPPPPLSLGALPRPGGADGVPHCGYPPMPWDPSAADPMKHPYKRTLCPQPPLPTVSTGLSLTASSSHPTEPPSNQMYSFSSVSRTSAAPADEDRKTAGVDRPWPALMFEGQDTTAFRTTMGKAPFAARTPRETTTAGLPDALPDLSKYGFRATNYFSSNASYDCRASEFGHCKSSKENEAAYLTWNAQHTPRMKQQPPPTLPSIHLPEVGDFSVMQSQRGTASASSSPSPSRPFYSFMEVGPVRCERPLSKIKADASDGVDLELKL